MLKYLLRFKGISVTGVANNKIPRSKSDWIYRNCKNKIIPVLSPRCNSLLQVDIESNN